MKQAEQPAAPQRAVTLDMVFNSPAARELLHEFAKTEYSGENMQFLKDCSRMADMVRNRSMSPENAAEALELTIFKYIPQGSRLQLNIVAQLRGRALVKMTPNELFGFLNEVMHTMLKLVERDSFPRFLKVDPVKVKDEKLRALYEAIQTELASLRSAESASTLGPVPWPTTFPVQQEPSSSSSSSSFGSDSSGVVFNTQSSDPNSTGSGGYVRQQNPDAVPPENAAPSSAPDFGTIKGLENSCDAFFSAAGAQRVRHFLDIAAHLEAYTGQIDFDAEAKKDVLAAAAARRENGTEPDVERLEGHIATLQINARVG